MEHFSSSDYMFA